MQKYVPKSGDGRLKWLHVIISNIKANIEGAYHGLDGTYLQRYLDEFCYRFNRRHSRKPLFDHLLACSVWAPYKTVVELIKYNIPLREIVLIQSEKGSGIGMAMAAMFQRDTGNIVERPNNKKYKGFPMKKD
jgi:hypothetical protein